MNTYKKLTANVFVAKCTEKHEKGSTIIVETKYGKENECVVFNLIPSTDDFFYYSIVRADGFNSQEWAKRKAKKLQNAAINAEAKSDQYWKDSNKNKEFLSMGEPIKVGHHSERRHRKMFEQANNAMRKCVEASDKAGDYQSRSEYWAKRANKIDLSMPESLEFFEFKLEEAKAEHAGLKNGTIPRDHAYSLTYAKKAVNDLKKKINIAHKLWGE